jgi:DNA-directed RNA polymerase specialized sigma24 family protein
MEEFYRRFFVPLVRRLVWRHGLSEEDARDVVQDAFLLGFVKLESFANPKAWFNQVVDHLAMNWRRKAKRHAELLARFGPLSEEPIREEQEEAEEMGLRGDVAAIHLVLADVLLDAGQEREAELEIRAALPIIDEEKMVPEGVAALSFLRESVRRRKIDRNALRELHGHFPSSG